jgi:eukaryotic-like serine/threonine-protein kinase
MSDEQFIEDLLVTWEEHREAGQSVSVEELCVDHPELTHRVRSRIEVLQRVYDMLKQPTAVTEDTVEARWADAVPTPEGYENLEYLGQGGASIVYKAWQPRLSRFVALKIIRERGQSSADRLERFRSEAKAAQLQHPNIVRIHDVRDHQGSPFLALEYLNAGTLADWVKGQPQDPRSAAKLVRTLANAVHYAHGRGIVHRDLKPANILFQSPVDADVAPGSRDGDHAKWTELTPKVADFGIAKFLDDADRVTMTGDVMGTPAYMAPEQAEGRTSEIGPATDIHALGIILYELLTGRAPFTCPSTMETLNQLRLREAIPPSQVQVGVPPDLENICLKCLRKEPHLRYDSADALAQDLQRFLDDLPVTARPLSRTQRLERWGRRNPLIATLTGALLIAVVTGFSLVTWKWVEADRARQQADANFAGIRQVVDDYLVIVGDDLLLNEPGMQLLREQLLTSALRYYEGFLNDHTADVNLQADMTEVRVKVAKIQRLLGSRRQAMSQLERALASQRSLLEINPDNDQQLATLNSIENDLAAILIELGNLTAAMELLERPIQRDLQSTAEQQVVLANSHHLAGVIHKRLGDTKQALTSFGSVVTLARMIRRDAPHTDVGQLTLQDGLIRVGVLRMEIGDHNRARPEFEEAIEVARHLVAAEPERWRYRRALSNAHNALGRLLARERDWEAADASFRESETILRELIRQNPRVVSLRLALCDRLVNFGSALQYTRPERALHYQHLAISLGSELLEQNPEMPACRGMLALAYNNAGKLHSTLGHVQSATESHQRAIDVLEELVNTWPDVVEYRDRLATSHAALSESHLESGAIASSIDSAKLAVDYGRELVAIAPEVIDYQRHLAFALHTLGATYCETENNRLGLPHLREAIAVLQQISDGEQRASATFRTSLARFHLDYYSYGRDSLEPTELDRSVSAGRTLVDELRTYRSADPAVQLTLAKLYCSMALVQQSRNQVRQAVEQYEAARDIVDSLVAQYPQVISYQDWMATITNNLGNGCRLLGQRDRSEQLFLSTLETLERVNESELTTQSRRNALAGANLNLGTLELDRKQTDRAVASFKRAIDAWDTLLQVSELTEARLGLVAAHGNIGHAKRKQGDPAAALLSYNQAIDHADQLLKREPQHRRALEFQQNTHWGRARALNELARFREAAADWRQVIKLASDASQPLLKVELAWSLVKSGDHKTATALADDIAGDDTLESAMLFNCARLFALAWGALQKDADLSEEQRGEVGAAYGARCVAILQELNGDGYFLADVRHVQQVLRGPEFLQLSSLSEFKAFVDSLPTDAVPADNDL